MSEEQLELEEFAEQLKTKKKKKKPEKKVAKEAESVDTDTYLAMLDCLYDSLDSLDEKKASSKETKIQFNLTPVLSKIGKRTFWTNFKETVSVLKRDPNHLKRFVCAELAVDGSQDKQQQLVLKGEGRYDSKRISSVLNKYIKEYVKCRTCLSVNTALARDQNTRLDVLSCSDCLSKVSVSPIHELFHATTRKDRKKARNTEKKI